VHGKRALIRESGGIEQFIVATDRFGHFESLVFRRVRRPERREHVVHLQDTASLVIGIPQS
jgi:hypothetical protein